MMDSRSRGGICPFCGSDDTSGDTLFIEDFKEMVKGSTIQRKWHCNHCDGTWLELYTYTDKQPLKGVYKKENKMSEKCQRCGKSYNTIYTLPNKIWRKISPKNSLSGLLCPECAEKAAREKGIILYWVAKENNYPNYINEEE